MTKIQDIFFPNVGAIKHVDYTSQEVCTVSLQRVFESLLCETWLRHLSNCIPVGHGLSHGLYSQFTFFVEAAGSGL